MLYTVLPGLTLCMSLLGNRTDGPPVNNAGVDESDLDLVDTNYLDAAIILIKAAKIQHLKAMRKEPLYERTEDWENAAEKDDSESEFAEGSAPPPIEKRGDRWPQRCSSRPVDCEDVLAEAGFRPSGVYRIWPRSRLQSGEAGFDVFCDMDTEGGGWTVIQRRGDYGSNPDFFYKDWQSYKNGFGDLSMDFWLGNDRIFALTNQRPSTLRIDLRDFEGEEGSAQYSDFYLDDERESYRLHIGDYRGNVGDSLTGHHRCRFSASDRDNDNSATKHCAALYKGGWWYNDCHTVNLNGMYHAGAHSSYADGVNWHSWRGFRYSLQRTEMKVRSSGFRIKNDTEDLFDS